MRSDLIAAGMVHHWLHIHASSLTDGWALPIDDELQGFITRILTAFPDIDAQFVGQSAIAATAIDLWNLPSVAVVGGGMPTPLSPPPHKVMYWTDINPQVVDEVHHLGYNTRGVDVKNAADIAQLSGIETIVATGLFHFLDDEGLVQVMQNFAQPGIRTLVFNNMNQNVDDALLQNWTKLGFKLYRRSSNEVKALSSKEWHIQAVLTVREFYRHHKQLASELSSLPDINNIYLAVKQ
jgi:hypothetical protein